MIKRALFILFSTVVLSMQASAQTNDSREDLQKQEQTLRKELEELKKRLNSDK